MDPQKQVRSILPSSSWRRGVRTPTEIEISVKSPPREDMLQAENSIRVVRGQEKRAEREATQGAGLPLTSGDCV